ncbi:hypothetical protein R5R35_002309 [Gryllus longicercus]|uniref:Cation-transporting P-type ATPase C-terminal domain-containing protein n=1 Tax=Gryllus longicercus TaxID=2509291 RepID=A0AAN9VWN7_9ORTH
MKLVEMAKAEHCMNEKGRLGLTTKEALNRLRSDIKSTIDEYQQTHLKRNYTWLKNVFHHNSQYTTVCWISSVVLVWNCLVLFFVGITVKDQRYSCLPFESLFVLFLLCVNIYVSLRENKLRHTEIPQRVCNLIEVLEEAEMKCSWLPENYPHLCSPYSPCITLQWTYRDGKLVNLPWALLVRGDIIDIRPGQQAPGNCIPIDDDDAPVLQAHDVYGPTTDASRDVFSVPTARTPLQNKKYQLEETPYLNNLLIALEMALSRPVTLHNNERHRLIIKDLEQHCLFVVLVCVILANILHYFYLSSWLGTGHWTEMFLVLPAITSLSLLPLVFPTAWILLDLLGIARIHAVLHAPKEAQMEMDPFEETDLEEPKHAAPDIRWQDVRHYFLQVIKGHGEILSHSTNLLHVLGSVTALCCVDKKGILSWPNPTAEKVFFLRNTSDSSCSSSASSVIGANAESKAEDEGDNEETNSKSTCFQHDYTASQTVAEVLDLTHDHCSPFRLQFDDQAWKKHLKSLKPLGLAILLNTCNMSTQEHYTQFCSHITCEALHNEDVVPVTNRRCLCELAKQIGFMDQAQDIFKLEEQLSTFRHVQPEMVRRDIKFARSLSIAKLKFPFPHMVAVVVREQSHGGLQLMAQGTADIILDSCVEFWDGHDLCPLSQSDRKKVQDFYQRTSLTAYCTAFAYRPLTKGVNSQMSEVYLELPADSKHLYLPHRSPTPLAWDFRNVLDPRNKTFLGQFHSTDSLLGNTTCEDDVNDVEGCFELQCNQVFIGMVTMQYQAQIDMVRLIEQLERACIRFVHFSKENELRSRVFSEKMGLESGWNCHISLLSDRSRSDSGHSESWFNTPMGLGQHLSSPSSLPKCSTHQHQQDGCAEEGVSLLNPRSTFVNSRALSLSAPSAINLEMAQVKFEDETHNWAEDRCALSQRNDHVTSQDSVLVHSVDLTPQQEAWRSLSCLTDSTEQSAPVNFDLRNRAKLPRGIEKIRPHLEQIDNVPLLVSLFTDCTPSVTQEMLKIMQDYGEVVCVMGSSANAENMPIFMQADASLAVEPLYPQVCQKVPVYKQTTTQQGPSPVELSRALNSIACSISFRREDPISIFHLIMECRHHMQCVRNCMQFWMCCAGAVSGIQVLNISLMLPPIFSFGQVLWLVCVIIPILSLSLVGKPTDPQVMQKATGKNQNIVNTEVITFLMWCYGVKFMISICLTLLCYGLVLSNFCTKIILVTNTTRSMVYPMPDAMWGGWQDFQYCWIVAQHVAITMVVLHFVALSISFVHRDQSIWTRSPHDNKVWLFAVLSVLCLQCIYSTIVLTVTEADRIELGIEHTPWLVLLLILVSPLIIFFISELVKKEEIKVNVRYQKRARLEFDTKLGMNSPF